MWITCFKGGGDFRYAINQGVDTLPIPVLGFRQSLELRPPRKRCRGPRGASSYGCAERPDAMFVTSVPDWSRAASVRVVTFVVVAALALDAVIGVRPGDRSRAIDGDEARRFPTEVLWLIHLPNPAFVLGAAQCPYRKC